MFSLPGRKNVHGKYDGLGVYLASQYLGKNGHCSSGTDLFLVQCGQLSGHRGEGEVSDEREREDEETSEIVLPGDRRVRQEH